MRAFLLSVTALFIITPALAQEHEAIQPLRPIEHLQPVEVRAVRAAYDAPFAKTDISGDSIRRANLGQDLPYLLQNTPSAVVTSDAGGGVGYTGLRIRGTDGTRINVTLNGVPVNDPESQITYFVDLPDLAASTSSIQIQRGVGTSTNGAGAFGATVSIANLGNFYSPTAEASVTYGSFNTQRYSVHAGTGISKNGLALDVRLSQLSSNGYMERSASNLRSLQVSAAWIASPKTTFQFMALQGQEVTHQAWNGVSQDSLATNRTYNELGLKSDGTYYDNQVDNYRQNYYQLFADHKFNSSLSGHLGIFLTRGIGYYEEYKTEQDFEKYGLQPFITTSDTFTATDLVRQLWLDNYNYGAVGSLQYHHNNTWLTLGGGFSQYAGRHYGYITWAQMGVPDHYRYYLLDAQKNDGNAYLKAEHRITNRFILFGDVQARAIGYFMNGFRNNPALRPAVSYFFFNPKAGATYILKAEPGHRQKVYASVAMASHEPNRDDFEASPNALPKPEQLTDVEAGYDIRYHSFHASLNAYYMHYRDQLVLTGQINDVGAYTRTNVPVSYRRGIELEGGWQPNGFFNLSGTATFSQNKISNFTEYLDNYDANDQTAVVHNNTDIAFSPNVLANLTAQATPARNFLLSLTGRFVGRQYLDNTGNAARRISDYSLLDARIHYTLKTRMLDEVGITLALNNILDRKYESNGYTYSYISGGAATTSNYYFPQAGFNWLLGVNLRW